MDIILTLDDTSDIGNFKIMIIENNNCFLCFKVLEKCTKNLIGHSRIAFNNHESNIDC